MNKPNLFIFGRQGSGKGMQSSFIVEDFGYQYISTGDLIRNRIKVNDKYGKKLAKTINSGNLVDDKNLFKIFNEYFESANNSKPFLLDGVPRTLNQLKEVDNIFKKLKMSLPIGINLNISRSTSVKRISTRKICPKCGKVYDPTIKGFKKNICTKCNVQLITRDDDQEEAVIKRLNIFDQQTIPVINKLKQEKRLIEINGEPPIENVRKQIRKKVFDAN